MPVRTTGFDRVEVWFDRKKSTAAMRMAAGAEYRVRLNPCSVYEIWASPEVEGVGSFSLISRVKSVIAVKVNGQESLSLEPGSKTEMTEYSGGAMCMHAPVTFSVEKTSATFLFLTNEKLEVTYGSKGFSFALAN